MIVVPAECGMGDNHDQPARYRSSNNQQRSKDDRHDEGRSEWRVAPGEEEQRGAGRVMAAEESTYFI